MGVRGHNQAYSYRASPATDLISGVVLIKKSFMQMMKDFLIKIQLLCVGGPVEQ